MGDRQRWTRSNFSFLLTHAGDGVACGYLNVFLRTFVMRSSQHMSCPFFIRPQVARRCASELRFDLMAHESRDPIRKQKSVDSPTGIEKSRLCWFMPCRM